jgi:putative redox protein
MSANAGHAAFADAARGMRVDARTDSGFTITFDTDESGDGRAGPSPMEAVLVALASCTSMDIASILRKKRQTAVTYEIAVSGERSEEHPRVYTSIVVEHRITGDVEPEALRRSVELSATRYCPVSAMLSATVRIEHRFRLMRDAHDAVPVSGTVVVTGPR